MVLIAKNQGKKPESDEVAEDKTDSVSGDNENKEEDYAQLKEHMLRIAAEFDNYKKRVRKELDNAERNGKASLIKEMLPIIDEFEIAMLAINGSKDANVAKGIEMLYSNFVDMLKKDGLSEIRTDDIFDPYKHEIVMVRESDKKEGTILEVVKKGYMFDDKMLRPASVIIAKIKEKNTEEKKDDA